MEREIRELKVEGGDCLIKVGDADFIQIQGGTEDVNDLPKN